MMEIVVHRCCRYYKDIQNTVSPDWLQKLLSIGLRPTVDITNFITMDLGRPLHVFDADKIKYELSNDQEKL